MCCDGGVGGGSAGDGGDGAADSGDGVGTVWTVRLQCGRCGYSVDSAGDRENGAVTLRGRCG